MSSYLRKTLAFVVTSAVFGFALRADAFTFADAYSASEFAGAYWFQHPAMSMSMELVITSDSRFKLTEIGCFGNSEVSRGSVAFRNGILILDPKLPEERGFSYELDTMIPVHWNDQLYLVDANRLVEFAEAISPDSGNCGRYCPGFFMRDSTLD